LPAPPGLYPRAIRSVFVVTEHPSALSDERKHHYDRIRRRLEHVSGGDVESVRYVDVGDLRGAGAVVLSGSFAPWAWHDPAALEDLGRRIRDFDGPVLGICAGVQLQAMFAGGAVGRAKQKVEGFGRVDVLDGSDLLRGMPASITVYKHHSDEIVLRPDGFRVVATSSECAVEAISCPDLLWWGTQFHPEEFRREHPAGERVLRNFFELARGI
jgi:GMP synthase-like glutamine amidotransferase